MTSPALEWQAVLFDANEVASDQIACYVADCGKGTRIWPAPARRAHVFWLKLSDVWGSSICKLKQQRSFYFLSIT